MPPPPGRSTRRQGHGRRLDGAGGESLAAAHLERLGYRVLERNFRAPGGEIDIVAEEGDVLCFVEVRARATRAYGDPLETIGPAKQGRLLRAARWYVAARRCHDRPLRFDVVGIVTGPETRITLVRGALEPSGEGW